MKVLTKLFFACGIVSGVLTGIGGVWLISQGTYVALLYNLATISAGFMMILLAAQNKTPLLRYTALAGALLCVLGFWGSAAGAAGVIGKLAGALGWPVFAFGYLRGAEENSPRRTAAGLVLFAGAVQLLGSFISMPAIVVEVLSVAIGAVQALLAWVLYREEPSAS